MTERVCWTVKLACVALMAAVFGTAGNVTASTADIVLYASEASVVSGNWGAAGSSGAAGGRSMKSADYGWGNTSAPSASPADYFETTFDAPAGTTYRVWLRLRAAGDSKWNDSVWVQFSDATYTNGSAAYRIGTTSALAVNLERCSGCGTAAWGWQNGAYWLSQATDIRFATAGKHTVRVQTREDGVEIDQIVLSPATYLWGAPGQPTNDAVVLSKSSTTSTPTTATPTTSTPTTSTPTATSASSTAGGTPYSGTPVSLPGTVAARDFNHGGQGVAYGDSTGGNTGGAYRSTDVDLEANAEGGHNVGWTDAGEWLAYTVHVSSSGNYTVRLRVASPNSGTSVAVAFDASGVSKTVTVPNTGSWRTWQTVEFTTYLSAGQQLLTLSFPQGGLNISRVDVAGGTTATTTTSPSSTSSSSSSLSPYSGSPVGLPGTIEAAQFDNGGHGLAYGDTTSGNTGGQFRNTDVDIEASSGGGYNIGWTAAGEWLNYTVHVATAGSYTVQLRVASPGGATILVGFNGPSAVWSPVSVPNTGGWQSYTTVNLPVTLGAGTQQLTLMFNTGGVNVRSITVASGAVSASSTPTSSGGSGGSGGSFRMMTWNIHHGRTKSGSYDPAAQARFIVSHNPHVVVLQEVQTWDENQPARYKSLLEQLTGVSWHLQWAPVTSSSGTEGNVVLTRLPVSSSTYHQMHATGDWSALYSNRSVAQTTVSVGGVPVHVFSTHLDYANTSYRTAQLLDMMDWTRQFGGRRIVGGDFNSWWGEWWITTMTGDYYDTWRDVTGSNDAGYTVNDAVRFDYLFRSKDGADKISPTNVYVPWTSLSDHHPVVADYVVRH